MACVITYNNKKYTQLEFKEYFKSHFFEFAGDFIGSKQDIEGFKDFVQSKQFQKLTAEEKAELTHKYNNVEQDKGRFSRLLMGVRQELSQSTSIQIEQDIKPRDIDNLPDLPCQ